MIQSTRFEGSGPQVAQTVVASPGATRRLALRRLLLSLSAPGRVQVTQGGSTYLADAYLGAGVPLVLEQRYSLPYDTELKITTTAGDVVCLVLYEVTT